MRRVVTLIASSTEIVHALGQAGPRKRPTIAIILMAVTVLTPVRASADGRVVSALHTELISSEPADGESLTVSPPEIRLVFSGSVEPTLSLVRLITADGVRLDIEPNGEDENQILVAQLPGLGNGTYTVDWSTVSVDGHKVEGRLVFRVARESLSIDTPIPAADTAPPGETPQAGSTTLSIGLGVLRGLSTGALLALAGLLIHVTALGSRHLGRTRSVVGALALIAPILLAVHAATWVQSITPRGGFDTQGIVAAFGTTAGRIESLRLVLAIAAGALVASSQRTALAAGLAVLAVAIGSASGHAVEFYPVASVPIKALHLIAVAIWLGGLLALAACALPSTGFHGAAQHVSRLALWAVAAIVVTGFAQSALIAGSPIDLLGTRYGALLGAKTVGLVGLVIFGARHRSRLVPLLDQDPSPARLTRSVAWETALMIIVLIVAGVLAGTPPPSN